MLRSLTTFIEKEIAHTNCYRTGRRYYRLSMQSPSFFIQDCLLQYLGGFGTQDLYQLALIVFRPLSHVRNQTQWVGMRSFIDASKVLSCVIPGCSTLLAKLDDAVAGRDSKDRILWTDDLHTAFCNAQEALSASRTITLPKPEDQLWVVTDGAIREPGIGVTLDVSRVGKLHVTGFFSAKLRGSQCRWLPFEIEALAISCSIKQFSPYLIQSFHKACILTDIKPCVQAYEKLCRGEFSVSLRVSTFLSAVSFGRTRV